jgi:predicted kinase
VALTERLPPAAYDSKVTARVFDRLRDLAARIVAAGYSVVADAVYARPGEREALMEVARRAGVPFTGFWLEAPTPLLEQRIAARRGDASDATVAVLRQQLTNDIGTMTWHRLDASGDAASVLAAARRVLAQSSAG